MEESVSDSTTQYLLKLEDPRRKILIGPLRRRGVFIYKTHVYIKVVVDSTRYNNNIQDNKFIWFHQPNSSDARHILQKAFSNKQRVIVFVIKDRREYCWGFMHIIGYKLPHYILSHDTMDKVQCDTANHNSKETENVLTSNPLPLSLPLPSHNDPDDIISRLGRSIDDYSVSISKRTQYKGVEYKSELEARHAVFFDTLGIRYQYESHSVFIQLPMHSKDTRYTIDFYLPDLDIYYEVKPRRPSTLDRAKCLLLSKMDTRCVVLMYGNMKLGFSFKEGTRNYDQFSDGLCAYTFNDGVQSAMECSWMELENGTVNVRPVNVLCNDRRLHTMKMKVAFSTAAAYQF